jgi:hypothetical protein
VRIGLDGLFLEGHGASLSRAAPRLTP